MAAGDLNARGRRRGEAAFYEAIAQKHEERAAMARRIGAVKDADDADGQAAEARAAAERARAEN